MITHSTLIATSRVKVTSPLFLASDQFPPHPGFQREHSPDGSSQKPGGRPNSPVHFIESDLLLFSLFVDDALYLYAVFVKRIINIQPVRVENNGSTA